MEPSDPDVIAAVLAGDRDRFRILVDRHGPALLGYIRRQVRDREEIREVFQETWVRAFEGLTDLRAGQRLRSWLISISHNTLRQRRRRRPEESQLSVDQATAAPSEVSTRLEREELSTRAAQALNKLPHRQREVFELRVSQELSHAEIGVLLQISEENSRAHFYQALRTLRARLSSDEP